MRQRPINEGKNWCVTSVWIAVIFMTPPKATQWTTSRQGPLLMICQTIGSVRFATRTKKPLIHLIEFVFKESHQDIWRCWCESAWNKGLIRFSWQRPQPFLPTCGSTAKLARSREGRWRYSNCPNNLCFVQSGLDWSPNRYPVPKASHNRFPSSVSQRKAE